MLRYIVLAVMAAVAYAMADYVVTHADFDDL